MICVEYCTQWDAENSVHTEILTKMYIGTFWQLLFYSKLHCVCQVLFPGRPPTVHCNSGGNEASMRQEGIKVEHFPYYALPMHYIM